MKPIFTLLAISVIFLSAGFSRSKPRTTAEALNAAYIAESNASAKYAAYAEVARKENHAEIEKLFRATSKAESIHAANHRRVMEMLDIVVTEPKIDPVIKNTTAENLSQAIAGEKYEYQSMYPEFLKIAEGEKISEAIVTFRYAMDTEKRHAILYQTTLDALKSNNTGSISTTFYVCPTCGNTYDLEDVKISCEFCGTLKPRFIIF